MIRDKKPYRVLVIEDNPGDFILIEDLLKEKILEPIIVRAVNFKAASGILSAPGSVFEVILLDLTLPDKSGQALITEMLQMAPHFPIIILTGNANVNFSVNSISQGISDYLLKDELNAATLFKSIVYAIEREKNLCALTESENRYSDLFQLNPAPVWVYDITSLRFLDVNDAARRHYGYSREEFLMMTIDELIVEDCAVADGRAAANRAYPQRPPIWFLRKKNGVVVNVEFHSNNILFDGKNAKLVVANDVTERERYTQEIENQNKKLREIAWLQSHVVRAPLARMMGIIDLISDLKIESPECTELLHHITNSANELDNIIHDIVTKTYLANVNLES